MTFTTGRGSAFGSKPSPCIKIATNTEMYERLMSDMDINAGAMLTEGRASRRRDEKYDMLLKVASGNPSKSEAQGLGDHEFVPWQMAQRCSCISIAFEGLLDLKWVVLSVDVSVDGIREGV